jgi:hypothetical protein
LDWSWCFLSCAWFCQGGKPHGFMVFWESVIVSPPGLMVASPGASLKRRVGAFTFAYLWDLASPAPKGLPR